MEAIKGTLWGIFFAIILWGIILLLSSDWYWDWVTMQKDRGNGDQWSSGVGVVGNPEIEQAFRIMEEHFGAATVQENTLSWWV